MITAQEVYEAEFRRAGAGVAGYDEVSVDDFLDRVIETLTALEHGRPLPAHPVTSNEVVETEFPERRASVSGGYDLDDVDDLLDRVAQRLFASESERASVPPIGAPQASGNRPDELLADEPLDDGQGVDDGGVADAEALAAASGAPAVTPARGDDRGSQLMGAAEAADARDGVDGAAPGQVEAAPAAAILDQDHASEVMGAAEAPVTGEAQAFENAEETPRPTVDGEAMAWSTVGAAVVGGAAVAAHVGHDAPHGDDSPSNAELDAPADRGAVNPVGADPIDEAGASVHHSEHVAADADREPVHPVGSDPEAPARPVASETMREGRDDGRRDVDGRDERDGGDAGTDHATREIDRRDAAFERTDVEGTDVEGADNDRVQVREPAIGDTQVEYADTHAARADAAADPSQPRSMGQSWDAGGGAEQPVQVRQEAQEPIAPEQPAATPPAPEPTFAPTDLPSADVSDLPDIAAIDDGWPEPEIISYPATDHRVPLPRNEIRRSMSDADRAAEAQYHPEFSDYTTPDEPFDPYADSRAATPQSPDVVVSDDDEIQRVAPANEETAGERPQRDPSTVGNPPAPVAAELAAREQERAAARERLDDVEAKAANADGAGAGGVVSHVVSAVANSGVVAAVQNAIGSHDEERGSTMNGDTSTTTSRVTGADGIGRPAPIDAPEPLDAVRKPESIDAPEPLPARDDTSRKGILRRIFKG